MANSAANSVTVYSRTASGNTAPQRTLSGLATGLVTPVGLALDLVNNELFVVNSTANSVTVYRRTASGNTAPLRTLSGVATGLNTPRGLALDLINDELYVANFGNFSITVYSRTASGNTAPLRTLSGVATGLNGPRGLTLDITNNELLVANRGNNSVTVYSRTASGNTAPLRTLGGVATGLSTPEKLALDLTNNELYVANFSSNSVTVYRQTASGNAAPLRTLSGAATGLVTPVGLALDLTNNELFVANATPFSVTVYRRTASGNTAPLRTLSGAATGLVAPQDLALPNNPVLVNISTRGQVGTGDDLMIGGLIIEGSTPKTVLLRGRGPSMGGAPFFVPGVLPNPLLRVFSGSTLIAQNDNWQDPPNCAAGFPCGTAAQITATGLDPCVPNPGQSTPPPNCVLESAILITLPPGAYTAQLPDASGGVGVGLVEAFDIDGSTTASFHNISSRGLVGAGDQIMIGGFIIEGNTPKTVLVRGRGPSMGGAPFFVPGTLPDPFVQVFSGPIAIAQNNNWQDAPSCSPGITCGTPAQITATGLDPCEPNPGQGAPPPDCTLESAILITLDPGAYTVQLSGAAAPTGVGLIEIFEIPF